MHYSIGFEISFRNSHPKYLYPSPMTLIFPLGDLNLHGRCSVRPREPFDAKTG